jgi:hypothetical protein
VILNRQIHLKWLPYCVNYKIKPKQINFEKSAKKIFGFENFSSQIRDKQQKKIINMQAFVGRDVTISAKYKQLPYTQQLP